ncbi:MAG TPA: GNAT family N-acetyltransferase [Myxococcota bacterium]|nr:GNAT family N-acetyltransferase [Myxococcota bacterium]
MKARRISRPSPGLWQELVAANPNASYFLTPAFAEIAHTAYGTPTELFAFECEDGARVMLPARRLATRRLRTYVAPGGGLPGGLLSDAPLVPERSAAVLRALAKVRDAAFRLSLDPRQDWRLPPAPERSLRTERFFVLDLRGGFPGIEAQRFAKDFREGCRRAHRRGVRVSLERGESAYADFARLHASGSQGWEAGSQPPSALYSACAAQAAALDAPLELVLARDSAGVAVAGILGVRRGDTWTCWLAAMDRQARALAPSSAAYRFAVEHACAAGAERFLLGASGRIASVEAFKRSLGAEPIEFPLHVEVRGTLREGLRRMRTFGRWVHDVARGTSGRGAAPPGGAGLGGLA